MNNTLAFQNLGLETKPSTSSLEDVAVTVNPDVMIHDHAKAYAREAERLNPLKWSKLGLTEGNLEEYFLGLLAIRVASLQPGGYKLWREAKQLVIPAWIQFVLSQIGVVTDHTYGLRFIPQYEHEVDLQSMMEVSVALESMITDGMPASKDAFPRSTEGDKDVMSFVILGDYVQGRNESQSPLAAYVAGFLGLRLKEESQFKMLYRVTYEDVNFIRNRLAYERTLLCVQ